MDARGGLHRARVALVTVGAGVCLATLVAACGSAVESERAPGGLQFQYQLVPEDGSAPSIEDTEAVAGIMRARLDRTGLTTFRVTPGPSGQVAVETDVEASDAETVRMLRDLLGATGRLQLVPMGDNAAAAGTPVDTAVNPPLLVGGVASAAVGVDQTGQRTLDLAFQPAGTKLIERWTTDHVGEVLGFALDGMIVTAPVVLEPIKDGQLQISSGGVGGFSEEDAERLLAILRSGAYPVPVRDLGAGDGP